VRGQWADGDGQWAGVDGRTANVTVQLGEMTNPIIEFIRQQGFMVLDGGLATELEVRGADLNDELWSAKVLLEDRDLISAVHTDYLRAGADCIVSTTYQASLQGFAKRGMSEAEAAEMLRVSVGLAVRARDDFWSAPENREGRLKPIVGACVGPYGAYLADGSEYTGDYGLDEADLYEFHRNRWMILADSGADIMACETIPSRREVQALVRLLEETPGAPTWISISCRDSNHVADGSTIWETLQEITAAKQVVAIGANCTSPRLIPDLVQEFRSVTDLPIMMYPNSGEGWDAAEKRWLGMAEPIDFGAASREWHSLGAQCIGGCCRTGPEHVRQIRRALAGPAAH
jgi:homocysteine S-methyltransferase